MNNEIKNMNWELVVADNPDMVAPRTIRFDCSSGLHCKQTAARYRSTPNGFNANLWFAIVSPDAKTVATTIDTSGPKLKWKAHECRGL